MAVTGAYLLSLSFQEN